MKDIGFSTGALLNGDWEKAFKIAKKCNIETIEISALRESEFNTLFNEMMVINTDRFKRVYFHAPSQLIKISEKDLVKNLIKLTKKDMKIVIHPDIIDDYSLWERFGTHLFIENMDNRKSIGRTADELNTIFKKLPKANMCFDIGHARNVDRTMNVAKLIVDRFHEKIKMIHLSEVDMFGKHRSISLMAKLSFQSILIRLIPNCPIILEIPITREEDLKNELKQTRYYLDHLKQDLSRVS